MKSLKHIKKLSTLLKLSMEDATKAARSKRFRFIMETWHTPSTNGGPCAICQAGATIAMRLDVPDEVGASYDGVETSEGTIWFDDQTNDRLAALNYLREGMVGLAVRRLTNQSFPKAAQKIFPNGNAPYDTHGESYTPRYRAAMRRLIKDLKRAGL